MDHFESKCWKNSSRYPKKRINYVDGFKDLTENEGQVNAVRCDPSDESDESDNEFQELM